MLSFRSVACVLALWRRACAVRSFPRAALICCLAAIAQDISRRARQRSLDKLQRRENEAKAAAREVSGPPLRACNSLTQRCESFSPRLILGLLDLRSRPLAVFVVSKPSHFARGSWLSLSPLFFSLLLLCCPLDLSSRWTCATASGPSASARSARAPPPSPRSRSVCPLQHLRTEFLP